MIARGITFAVVLSIIGWALFRLFGGERPAYSTATEPTTTVVASKDEVHKDKQRNQQSKEKNNSHAGAGAHLAPIKESVKQTPDTPADVQDKQKNATDELADASTDELIETTKTADNANVRAAAITTLGERQEDPSIMDAYVSALKDKDSGVRRSVLREFLSTDQPPPADVLNDVVVNDPDPMVRREALDLLVFKYGIAAANTLEVLQNGPDPNLRARATELLDYLSSGR